MIDTQSVKTSTNVPLHTHGVDAGKKIVGRKRGIVTDTLGLLLAVIVTTAAAGDNTIGIDLLDQAEAAHPDLAKAWVDTGFNNRVIEHVAALNIDVEVVTKDPRSEGSPTHDARVFRESVWLSASLTGCTPTADLGVRWHALYRHRPDRPPDQPLTEHIRTFNKMIAFRRACVDRVIAHLKSCQDPGPPLATGGYFATSGNPHPVIALEIIGHR